ncbi:MAG TPA: DegT/DnrJ/EryC1/StrS family aminotransferase [Terriglobales bacterium]|jgi:dTDP-4-amino-4,6-dideoxygalactose transaminase|nr:DegT/DnrJ/EryC1/StrS family aminotransferase [Terriglobales bacterium]
MNKVAFVDLYQQHQAIEEELVEVFRRVLRKSSFILGPEVVAFEKEFAAYIGASDCIAVNNGTAALQLVLAGLGIGPGDEVITVANTFIATAEAISAVGARPVFVDVDPVSYTMDPQLVEAAITPNTKALLPVHLYGQAADVDALLEIARRHNLHLVEDACQAHGATYKGRKAGSLGVAGCFSFYPGKNLGCLGEGGAVVTSNPELAQRMRMLRDHGSVKKYEHSLPGYNFRLEGLQGGFLSVKLRHLDRWNVRRREVAKLYHELLSESSLGLPVEMGWGEHVYHLYVIQADDREALRNALNAAGVECGLHYPVPLHLQAAYADLGYEKGSFPVSEHLSGHILSLPMHPFITDEEVKRVASVLLESLQCQSNQQTVTI